MFTATMTMPETDHQPQPAPSPAPIAEWITLAAASRRLQVHVNAVKSIALAGAIRTRALPGARILYRRADVERLVERLAATG